MPATSHKDLRHIRHWIFDMDGTLTIAQHDFAMMKKVLEIPEEEDILTNLEALPLADKNARLRWLMEYELLQDLAFLTLTAAKVDHFFPQKHVIGRENATPKPSPDAILMLLAEWNIDPTEAVIVGDHEYDLAAGRNAGIQTILVNHDHNIYPDLADYYFESCEALLNHLHN